MDQNSLKIASETLCRARKVVALTGAGISVESGIPDFRSEDGLWTKYPPEEYATLEAFRQDPDKVWTMWYELVDTVGKALPNPAHKALVRLEALNRLDTVITQNIDNLHAVAGNSAIVEYHGNIKWMICAVCFRGRTLDLTFREIGAPPCECGGFMKPDVVLFGEDVPKPVRLQAQMAAQTCDTMLVIGTSAMVYPAAELPALAKERGATIIECNLGPTDLSTEYTDILLVGPAGQTLPALVDEVAQGLKA